MVREFLQLAHKWDGQQSVAAWLWSPKLDGMRCWFDGGITRGMELKDVPWANVVKDGRYLVLPKATGLWTRYGKSIQAPDWFLDQLPEFPLDGELWCGRGGFQHLMSTVKKLVPDPDWESVQYHVFDSPSYREVLADGEIRNKGKYEKRFQGFLQWIIPRLKTDDRNIVYGGRPYEHTFHFLVEKLKETPNLQLLLQNRLPYNVQMAKELLIEEAEKEVAKGGEGLMVRIPNGLWVPKRSRTLLKVKPHQDAEGLVVGYVWGEETDLGSKLLGMMGSVIVNWKGKQFRLSGFTDEEREMLQEGIDGHVGARMEGCNHPGETAAVGFYNPKFPFGSTISFKYREVTDDGLPKEARYWRKREE